MFNFKCYDRRCSFSRASSLWLVSKHSELKVHTKNYHLSTEFRHTEFLQLTSIMESTLCPCAQTIPASFQQPSQMSITWFQQLLVCPLLEIRACSHSDLTDKHAFGRSQQARAVSASPGCSAVYFC